MTVRLKRGNFIALLFFYFHRGVTQAGVSERQIYSHPASACRHRHPQVIITAASRAWLDTSVFTRLCFQVIFNAAVAFAVAALVSAGADSRRVRVPALAGVSPQQPNPKPDHTHAGHWLMVAFIVYYYGFILRAGSVHSDLSAGVHTCCGFNLAIH